jgi:hypothetical protein
MRRYIPLLLTLAFVFVFMVFAMTYMFLHPS